MGRWSGEGGRGWCRWWLWVVRPNLHEFCVGWARWMWGVSGVVVQELSPNSGEGGSRCYLGVVCILWGEGKGGWRGGCGGPRVFS